MTIIAPAVGIAKRPHRVSFETPLRTPDGDGGFVETWSPLDPPALFVEILPATAQALERVGAGTVSATATHVVTGPWHPQINTRCRVLFNGRIFQVIGVSNQHERSVEMVLVCAEYLPETVRADA